MSGVIFHYLSQIGEVVENEQTEKINTHFIICPKHERWDNG
jgi:hypothetical protein